MKLIEFVGMPRSGKTTQAELLKKALETRGKGVTLLVDRERMAALAVPPQEPLAFSLAYYSQLVDAYYRYQHATDVLIIDRGWNDAPVWAEVYRVLKVVTDEEAAALATCFARFARLASAVVHVTVPTDVSLERHRATLHEQVDDVVMNAEWLTALADAYARRKDSFTNAAEVDGTLPPDEVHARIVEFLDRTGSV